MKKIAAFTMLEIIVVMVILGILAAIAVPNMNNAIARAQVQDAKNNLLAIYAGQQNLFARSGAYLRNAATNVNTGLSIAVASNNINYVCDADPAAPADLNRFRCTATRTGGGFVMQVTNGPVVLSNDSPYPNCTTTANPCCTVANPCP